MNERKAVQRALEHLHASDRTLEEVMKMINGEKAKKHAGRVGRSALRTGLIAAALAALFTVSAYAIGEYTGFFETVFGGPDAGKEVDRITVDSWDENGVARTMDIIVEGVPVDQELAESVLGDKVVTVDRSVTIGDFTCTVEKLAMADNGMGVMTYSIESEKGFSSLTVTDEVRGFFYLDTKDLMTKDSDGREVQLRYMPMICFAGETGGGRTVLDAETSLVSCTDTKLEAVTYMAVMDAMEMPDAMDVYFFWGDEENFSESYRMTMDMPECAVSEVLTGPEGWTALVSPIGLALDLEIEGPVYNMLTDDVVIHYADGTDYVVTMDEPYTVNHWLSCVGDGRVSYVFNRLIDPAEVQSVTAWNEYSFVQDENGRMVDMTGRDDLPEGSRRIEVSGDLTFVR